MIMLLLQIQVDINGHDAGQADCFEYDLAHRVIELCNLANEQLNLDDAKEITYKPSEKALDVVLNVEDKIFNNGFEGE